MKKLELTLMIICATLILSCNKEENCQEKEIEGCFIAFDPNPVCGCNGVTYSNPSSAICNNITDYTMGACE